MVSKVVLSKFKAVIGSAYGDEGKGRWTNHMATRSSLVVRANGGSQAGHTVVHSTPTGEYRHVFSSYGSATLKGASTLLAAPFVVNPVAFIKEGEALEKQLGRTPEVFIDENCPITTLFEIALNRSLEDSRGDNRHGSVGSGFGETLEREANGYHLRVKDVLGLDELAISEKLHELARTWFPRRIKALARTLDFKIGYDFTEILGLNDGVQERHILKTMAQEIQSFLSRVMVVENHFNGFNNYDMVIFEGAQGLMLDQDHGSFPHVTRSNTGLKNIYEVLGDNSPDLDVFYMTRAYTTRHGAGPFPFELAETPYTIVDETNKPHDYQGTLRFSYLNLDTIGEAIRRDLSNYGKRNTNVFGVMTCCDQVIGHEVHYIKDNQVHSARDVAELRQLFSDEINCQAVYATYHA